MMRSHDATSCRSVVNTMRCRASTTDLQDVASCDFIIENVTEDWHVKKPVYEQLDRVAPREVCFGANTACIPITQIATAPRRPANGGGLPLMNPVHLQPTVEGVRGV